MPCAAWRGMGWHTGVVGHGRRFFCRSRSFFCFCFSPAAENDLKSTVGRDGWIGRGGRKKTEYLVAGTEKRCGERDSGDLPRGKKLM